MRIMLLIAALAMPAVSWFSQQGWFGPSNGAISDRYPTLLVAAGYAFAMWGLIFVLDVVFGIWQTRGRQHGDPTIARVRLPAAAGFLLTAVWMPIFSQQVFWLALLVIWSSLACLLYCAVVLARDRSPLPGQIAWAWLPLSLHAGWLSLAALLNTAQVIVAYRWLNPTQMLPWSLALFAVAAALLLYFNLRMRGNIAYMLIALWGLIAVYLKQSQSLLPGATAASWVAAVIGVVLAGQTLWLRMHRERRSAARLASDRLASPAGAARDRSPAVRDPATNIASRARRG